MENRLFDQSEWWEIHLNKAPDGQTVWDKVRFAHLEHANICLAALLAAGYADATMFRFRERKVTKISEMK